jgi:hypothetical protein
VNDDSRLAAVEAELASLRNELGIQQDIEAIRRLHYSYMHYTTSRMTGEVIDLVAEGAESIEIAGRGVYYGKRGFITNLAPDAGSGQRARGQYPHGFGNLLFQVGGMGVISVAPDRQTAKARFTTLTPSVRGLEESQVVNLNMGVYENGYVREDGTWKISKLKYVHYACLTLRDLKVDASYSQWPDAANPPDAPTTWYHPYPEAGALPFHYANPVTGEMPPEALDPTHYWRGNWPGEEGQTGHV